MISTQVTSTIALAYLLNSLIAMTGPALFDDGDPSVRKGGVHKTWPCSVILFGHVWLLHPVGRLSFKQSLFWPYMVEGFAVLAYFGLVAAPVAFLPVAVQFVGRWGLYLFVTHKFNIVPGTPYYDAFEDRKQPLELAAVLGGVAVACLA